MKFKLVENINLDEDLEIAPGLTFRDLMRAAENGDCDFILNPPGVNGEIRLKEEQWNRLYDALFDVEHDTTFTPEEYKLQVLFERQFDLRYRCV